MNEKLVQTAIDLTLNEGVVRLSDHNIPNSAMELVQERAVKSDLGTVTQGVGASIERGQQR